MVELHSMNDFESLTPDKWGIPTPSEASISSRANCFGGTGITNGETKDNADGLDLIVMPGMAFDSNYGRLGHGKGFYDSFLTRCHQVSRMPFRGKNDWYFARGGLTNHVKVGLSLTEQFLPHNESVPMDSSDYRLDALVTGDGALHRATA
jgi:5-formyltetrahydrofolate cyclo-ligase